MCVLNPAEAKTRGGFIQIGEAVKRQQALALRDKAHLRRFMLTAVSHGRVRGSVYRAGLAGVLPSRCSSSMAASIAAASLCCSGTLARRAAAAPGPFSPSLNASRACVVRGGGVCAKRGSRLIEWARDPPKQRRDRRLGPIRTSPPPQRAQRGVRADASASTHRAAVDDRLHLVVSQ